MLRWCLLTAAFFAISGSLAAGVVIDRIAVVVNRHPIKTSDIDHDIRLTNFLNAARPNPTPAERKAAMERLIDQELIRSEVASGRYPRATDKDAQALLDQIKRDRFGNSDARLRAALSQYGITYEELRAQLLWQLTALRFINERFRSGVLVSDDDIQKYYEKHRSAFHDPFEKVSGTIRTSLEGEQVNQQFETWLAEARKSAAIDYKVDFRQEATP